MFSQQVLVRYIDGTEKQVTTTQWSMGQFAQWSARQGLTVDLSNPGLMGVVMLRYQAYCELHREGARPSFEKWDATVEEVEPITEAEEVDPTQSAGSGG